MAYCKQGGKECLKKGDVVRLKTGKAPIKIEDVGVYRNEVDYIYGSYVQSGTHSEGIVKNYVMWEDSQETKQEKEKTMALYEVKAKGIDTVRYATYLATNGKGEWVMEEKGSGDIFTTAKEDASEVMPYTFGVKFSLGGKVIHYAAQEGKLKMDDVLLVAGEGLGSVIALNTKIKEAKEFKGVRILSETI